MPGRVETKGIKDFILSQLSGEPNTEYLSELTGEFQRVITWCLFHRVDIPPDVIFSTAIERVSYMHRDGLKGDIPFGSSIPREYLDQADYEI